VTKWLCEVEDGITVTVEVPSPVRATLADIIAAEGEPSASDCAVAGQYLRGERRAGPRDDRAQNRRCRCRRRQTPRIAADDVGCHWSPHLANPSDAGAVSTWLSKMRQITSEADEMLCELETKSQREVLRRLWHLDKIIAERKQHRRQQRPGLRVDQARRGRQRPLLKTSDAQSRRSGVCARQTPLGRRSKTRHPQRKSHDPKQASAVDQVTRHRRGRDAG